MRHSLFFGTIDEATDAQNFIQNDLDLEDDDIYQSSDGETGAIEVRFHADHLTESTQRRIIRYTEPNTYALNCEDY